MATVVVKLESTKDQSFPAGTVLSGYSFSINGATPQTISAAPFEATFADVSPGDNVATVQALDGAGAPLGDPASAPFTVPQPDVVLQVPAVVTVTL
jgi:hypothetical protein